MWKDDRAAYEPIIPSERVWRIIVLIDASDIEFCGSNIGAVAALTLQYACMGTNASIFNGGGVDMTANDMQSTSCTTAAEMPSSKWFVAVCGYFLAILSPMTTF